MSKSTHILNADHKPLPWCHDLVFRAGLRGSLTIADNLPQGGYWFTPTRSMGDEADSFIRNYGLHVEIHQVEAIPTFHILKLQDALDDARATFGTAFECELVSDCLINVTNNAVIVDFNDLLEDNA